MPRKAATQARNRLAAGAETSYGVEDSEDEQGFDTFDSETEEHAARPVLKKQTRRSSVRTTRKGKLSGLLRLPAELITTICQHLDLGTLFHVSRLNKYLWRLLRQTSSLEYLWEPARIESGLHKLDAVGMNVFQYANLVFGCCQGCGSSTSKVDYTLRSRYCAACAKAAIWSDRDGFCEGAYAESLIAPVSTLRANGQEASSHKYLVSEIRHIRSHLADMDRDETGSCRSRTTDQYENRCQHVVCATLGDRYTSLEFRDAWMRHSGQRAQDGILLSFWQMDRDNERQKELDHRRQRRREAIEAKFAELGWHPHHFEASWWREHSLVKVAREFSENVWRSIKAPLTAQLELHRDASDACFLAEAHTRRRIDIVSEYVKLPPDEARQLGIAPKPRVVDFEKYPTVQAIIEVSDVQEVYDEPNPTIRDHIDGIIKDLRVAVDQLGGQLWEPMRETIQQMQPHAPVLKDILVSDTNSYAQQSSPNDGMKGILDLAIAVFKCESKYCRYVDTFPHVLSHECMYAGPTTRSAYRPSETATINILKVLQVRSVRCDTTAAELDELGSTWTCLEHPEATMACTWREICSAENIVQETLEAAKDRVYA